MNLSYRWLRDLVAFELAPELLAEKLNSAGIAIEALEKLPDGDTRLVAEITSNRGDCLGHYGVAREISAITGAAVKFPPTTLVEKKIENGAVTIEDAELCPRYVARLIKNVTVKASPQWLQDRLIAVGLRPINNIVDATNFILYEQNQPLHAFDFDKLAGGKIVVRRAHDQEKFRTLTEIDCALNSEMLVIADGAKAVAIAGIMGGLNSEVSGATRNILLESAFFSPPAIRRTAGKLKLSSDSSYRYERGIDIGGCERVSARAAQLIVEIAGGEVFGVIDAYPNPVESKIISLRYAECAAVLGVEIPAAEIRAILTNLDFAIVNEDAEKITVKVPPRRRDLEREIDLIEEIIRLAGFDRVPDKFTMPLFAMPVDKNSVAEKTAREQLARLGACEYVTDSFIPEKWEDSTFSARIENPVDLSRPCLRQSLLPSLLDRRRVNRGERETALFELNTTYRENPRSEKFSLAVLDDRGTEFVFGAFIAVARALKITAPLSVKLADDRPFFAARSRAEIWLGDKAVGQLGIIAPAQKALHDLDESPAAGEIDFAEFVNAPSADRVFQPLPRFPGIRRDLALVVPEKITWEQIASIANEIDALDYAVESVYRGKGVGAGKKSVAFTFTYFAADRSLTNEEANVRRDRLLQHLLAKIDGAVLR